MPIGYDLLNWTSFPSSLKLINDTAIRNPWITLFINLPVNPNSKIKTTIQVKELNALADLNGNRMGVILYTSIKPSPPKTSTGWDSLISTETPLGTHDWMPISREGIILPNKKYLHACLVGSAGSPEIPAITWFDDLKIFQDDVLIYSNDFSNWAPVIIPAEIITGVAIIKYLK